MTALACVLVVAASLAVVVRIFTLPAPPDWNPYPQLLYGPGADIAMVRAVAAKHGCKTTREHPYVPARSMILVFGKPETPEFVFNPMTSPPLRDLASLSLEARLSFPLQGSFLANLMGPYC